MVGNKLTPLYEKGIKQTQNKPMETTWTHTALAMKYFVSETCTSNKIYFSIVWSSEYFWTLLQG